MEDFQDVLKQAADIKAAQLRERPGRQDWERAPEWFKYTAYADKEVTAARLGPLNARLELCQGYKDEGNERYEAEDVPGALQLYTRALSLFVWFDRGADKAREDIPYVNSVARMEEGQDKAQINALVTILFNNAASCLIRLEQNDGAIYAASKALEHDPYNVKALYRRAAARRAGGTSAGMEAAVRDLQQAQTLEPGNIQVWSALALYQKELLEQNRKDAALYGNMFARGQLYDDKDEKQGAGEAQVEDIGRDKSKDPSPHEVARALRGMQAGMQRAQGRPPPATWGDALLPFSFLPWWAWMLIVLHLLYRIAKLWRVPMPWATPTRVVEQHDSGWQEEL